MASVAIGIAARHRRGEPQRAGTQRQVAADRGAAAGSGVGETDITGDRHPPDESVVDHRQPAHLGRQRGGQQQGGDQQGAALPHRNHATVNATPSWSPIAALKRRSRRGVTLASSPKPSEKSVPLASPKCGVRTGWM